MTPGQKKELTGNDVSMTPGGKKEARGVMFPWLLSHDRNSQCRKVNEDKCARRRRHDSASRSACLSLHSTSFAYSTLSKRIRSESQAWPRLENKASAALETANARITTILEDAPINPPDEGPCHQTQTPKYSRQCPRS